MTTTKTSKTTPSGMIQLKWNLSQSLLPTILTGGARSATGAWFRQGRESLVRTIDGIQWAMTSLRKHRRRRRLAQIRSFYCR